MYNTYVLKSVKAIMICFLVDVKVSDINQGANDLRISEANNLKGFKSPRKFKGSTATHLMSRSIGLRVTSVKNFVYLSPHWS